MNLPLQLMNINPQLKEYLFCPNETCLNVPEVSYSYNPLNSEIHYKCKCNNNYNNEMNKELDEFLEKSNIICYECKKPIMEINFLFCKNCNKNIHILCEKFHSNNNKNHNAEFINKNHILNQCKNHNSYYIFRCMECKESLCGQCDLFSHNQKHHHLKQLMEFDINENELTKMKSALNTQKNFLMKIKNINSAYIKKFENDIQIKQKIINNYIDNKSNYCSVLNLKNVYLKNNEKYENVLNDLINNNEENQNNENKILDIDKYTDEILLPFYYSMMINKDKSVNDSILNKLEEKIQKLKTNKTIKMNNYENQDNNLNINNNHNFDKNNNIINSSITSNSLNIPIFKEISQYSSNQTNSNNQPNSNIQGEKNEFSLFSFKDDISNLNNNIQMNVVKKENIDKDNKKKIRKKSKLEKKKSKEKREEKNKENEVKQIDKDEGEVNIRNNMIALKSGNFAISIKKKVKIYNFRMLDILQNNDFFDKNSIKKCLIQEISLDKSSNGKYIGYIFQFIDETLFCSIYSKIIRIKLLNDDKENKIIGFINLENMEIIRKIISLGSSMLAILSDKDEECKIRIYSNQDDNINNYLNNNNIKKDKKILPLNDKNKENQVENNNDNYIIKEDDELKLILDNINKENVIWTSIFEIKKSNNITNEPENDENYLYEFISTSNAELAHGDDIVAFYGVEKIFDKYNIKLIKKINGISCSCEFDAVCQLNKNYICIGLQDYKRKNQKNGFALIDVHRKELYKIIETDGPISSIFYNKEKQLLFTVIEIGKRKSYFKTIIYKFMKNIGNNEKDVYELNEIYQNKSKQTDVISSIYSLIIHNFNNTIILIITSSQFSKIEIIKAEIKNL